jgi:two-component system cell cycle sensor histidine kinase PleC
MAFSSDGSLAAEATTLDADTLKGVLEHLEQAISVFDGQLRLVLWNRNFRRLFDLPDRLLQTGTPFETIVRFNAERGEYGKGDVEQQVAERLAQAQSPVPHRTERVRPDGTIIEIVGNPLPNGGFVTSYTDVTVARQISANLRYSNERLDQMVERRTQALSASEDRYRVYAELLEATVRHMPQGVCVFDQDLNLVVANDGFFDLTQLPKSFNKPGKPFEDFMLFNAQRGEYGPGNHLELARARVEQARKMEPHVFERQRPDGTVIEVHGNPIPGRGFISTFADVTSRHQAEEALREAATMARAMLDAPGLIVLLFTLEGTILDANEAARASMGLADPKGANLWSLMPPNVAERRWAHACDAAQEGRAIHFEDSRDGRWFETTVIPYPTEPNMPQRVMAIAHDVTQRHEGEQRLREAKAMAEAANRTKTEFLAAMSHELRTPLNAIIGFSEIIATEMFGTLSERYRTYGRDINHAGQHLLDMINDILDISRIEIGAFNLNPEPVAPRDLAQSTLRLVATRAEKNAISLVEAVSAQLPDLMVDMRRTKQVLLNLLANAVKFTPSGGRVALSGQLTDDGGFCFTVADNGIGMTEEEQAVALSPFGQVDSGLDRRFEGVGLGLPLAKSLAELHGGTLAIQSEPGRGTTVTVTFPPRCVLS